MVNDAVYRSTYVSGFIIQPYLISTCPMIQNGAGECKHRTSVCPSYSRAHRFGWPSVQLRPQPPSLPSQRSRSCSHISGIVLISYNVLLEIYIVCAVVQSAEAISDPQLRRNHRLQPSLHTQGMWDYSSHLFGISIKLYISDVGRAHPMVSGGRVREP